MYRTQKKYYGKIALKENNIVLEHHMLKTLFSFPFHILVSCYYSSWRIYLKLIQQRVHYLRQVYYISYNTTKL